MTIIWCRISILSLPWRNVSIFSPAVKLDYILSEVFQGNQRSSTRYIPMLVYFVLHFEPMHILHLRIFKALNNWPASNHLSGTLLKTLRQAVRGRQPFYAKKNCSFASMQCPTCIYRRGDHVIQGAWWNIKLREILSAQRLFRMHWPPTHAGRNKLSVNGYGVSIYSTIYWQSDMIRKWTKVEVHWNVFALTWSVSSATTQDLIDQWWSR